MKIEDAKAKLSESQILFKKGCYPGALLAMQQCLELSSKALLDESEISYIQKGKQIPHDISDKFPEAFLKIKEILTLSEYDEEKYKKSWAEQDFCLRFLHLREGILHMDLRI